MNTNTNCQFALPIFLCLYIVLHEQLHMFWEDTGLYRIFKMKRGGKDYASFHFPRCSKSALQKCLCSFSSDTLVVIRHFHQEEVEQNENQWLSQTCERTGVARQMDTLLSGGTGEYGLYSEEQLPGSTYAGAVNWAKYFSGHFAE